MKDTYTFGPILRLRDTGAFTPETWKDRWADEIARVVWPSDSYVVSSVNPETGVITLELK